MKTKVAIIGKTNTGKSTLFNYIVGFRKAIVLPESGVTRDRNYTEVEWHGKVFTLIDTGGIDYNNKDKPLQKMILDQAEKAISESEIILFLLDVMTGIQQEDIDIAAFIRNKNKKVILAINKNDIKEKNYFLSDFYQLGLGEPCLISAEQGTNIYELLDRLTALIPDKEKRIDSAKDFDIVIRVAIIGKPNVGKSSILNAILKEERIIVDESPGTTRDAIEVSLEFDDYKIIFVDTAGLRRKKSVKNKIEYYGNLRAIDSIKKADIVLLVLDGTQIISMQDKRLANRIIEEKKACIVLLNKFDLVKKEIGIDKNQLLKISKYSLKFLKDALILTTIAIEPKKDFLPVLKAIIEIFKKYNKKIVTSKLNNFLQNIVNKRAPKIVSGKRIHFYYITQVGTKPPAFKIFVNNPELLYNSYQRYMENQFVKNFDFKGIPILFYYEKRK
ncbi:MAG: ribosome biogenesis GTPase Der [Atribacterota bacterium]|jgi:GTP-binding protein|nr:ribosome biogenesis GTPase Der [Atribacterota bacterium]